VSIDVYLFEAITFAMPFKPFLPSQQTKSRIRISSGTFGPLRWDTATNSFDCIGFFRAKGELLCAPAAAIDDSGEHPFAEVIAIEARLESDNSVGSLRNLPQVRTILARDRIIRFQASWTSEARNQLDINLGAEILGILGWHRPPVPVTPIYLSPFAGILYIVSESHFVSEQFGALS
jgi:hypothetical protein